MSPLASFFDLSRQTYTHVLHTLMFSLIIIHALCSLCQMHMCNIFLDSSFAIIQTSFKRVPIMFSYITCVSCFVRWFCFVEEIRAILLRLSIFTTEWFVILCRSSEYSWQWTIHRNGYNWYWQNHLCVIVDYCIWNVQTVLHC